MQHVILIFLSLFGIFFAASCAPVSVPSQATGAAPVSRISVIRLTAILPLARPTLGDVPTRLTKEPTPVMTLPALPGPVEGTLLLTQSSPAPTTTATPEPSTAQHDLTYALQPYFEWVFDLGTHLRDSGPVGSVFALIGMVGLAALFATGFYILIRNADRVSKAWSNYKLMPRPRRNLSTPTGDCDDVAERNVELELQDRSVGVELQGASNGNSEEECEGQVKIDADDSGEEDGDSDWRPAVEDES